MREGPPVSRPGALLRAGHAGAGVVDRDARRRRQLAWTLALAALLLLLLGLMTGAQGLSLAAWHADWQAWRAADDGQAALILGQIRAPRTLGALATGALLGMAGAIAQGLLRNPLADPYLLGTASGAALGVVLVLAGGAIAGQAMTIASAAWMARIGIVGAAFAGALAGVALTLLLARGALHTLRLLLAGVVVGVALGAASDLVTTWVPDALRGKQAFLLGSTALLAWPAVALLGAGLALLLPPALRLARALDALTLGEDTAATLGLPLARLRLALVALLALATALAVSQAGLVAFVGLVAPHLVRRAAPSRHGYLIAASAAAGGVLLLASDLLARSLAAPQELPVGALTALLGGGYLLWLLHRRGLG
ncbi:MAG: iron ABC transporter permease [Burkholderiaceae bacterium]|jgi:iron complex transport system permease protein|nr:iron ABC transporter permease [Burkholderiaceae bacterium]